MSTEHYPKFDTPEDLHVDQAVAYSMGYLAHWYGLPVNVAPWDDADHRRTAWVDGWQTAELAGVKEAA
jgi:hypothetical protein